MDFILSPFYLTTASWKFKEKGVSGVKTLPVSTDSPRARCLVGENKLEKSESQRFLLRCTRLKTVALLRAPTEVVIAFVQQWAATPGTPALPPPPPESS